MKFKEPPSPAWLLYRSPLTISPLALSRALEVSPDLIYDAIRRNEIPTVMLGRRRRIPRDAAVLFARPLLDHLGMTAPNNDTTAKTDAVRSLDTRNTTDGAGVGNRADSGDTATANEDPGTETSQEHELHLETAIRILAVVREKCLPMRVDEIRRELDKPWADAATETIAMMVDVEVLRVFSHDERGNCLFWLGPKAEE
jgi:excisionase family DNA binding protein